MFKTYDLAGLVPPLWHPGTIRSGSLGTPWGTWEQQEGHVRVRNIFSDFRRIWGLQVVSRPTESIKAAWLVVADFENERSPQAHKQHC